MTSPHAVGRRRWRCVAAVLLICVVTGGALGAAGASAAVWSLQTTPNATGADHSTLSDIACGPSSTNACTAVGRSSTAGIGAPYAQYWNGGSWVSQPAASPAGATDAELKAAHCVSATSCAAAGSYTTGSGTFSLVEVWNGSSWSIQTTPNPVGATETRLSGVACTSSVNNCTVVGFATVGGVRSAIAMRSAGGTWSVQSVPTPGTAIASEFNGVDCPAASSCVAVGRSTNGSGVHSALSTTWNGTAWTLQTVPNPAGARRSVLLDVSCSDVTHCTGVGAFLNASGVQVTLAERWDGRAWSVQTTPNPAGSTNSVLQNVTCDAANTCVAVGDWVNGSSWVPMAQYWNDATDWLLDAAANRAGVTFGILEAVDCRGLSCLAVGWTTDASAERHDAR